MVKSKEKKPEIIYEDGFRRIITGLIKKDLETRGGELSAKEQAETVSDILSFYQESWLSLIESTVIHHLDITLEPADEDEDEEDEDEEDED